MRHETDMWVVEKDIRELPEVVGCRVIAAPDGRPQHIELLLRPDSPQEAVLAQVRELVSNSLGVEVSPQDITAAALPAAGEVELPAGEVERPRLARVAVVAHGNSLEAEVALTWRGREGRGVRRGARTYSQRNRMVAEATLLALENLLGRTDLFALDEVVLNQLATETVVVALVSALGEGWEQLLTGASRSAAPTGTDEAVARATLSAVNRFFPRLAHG